MKLRHKVSLLAFLVGGLVLFSTLLVHEYISHKSVIHDTRHNMIALSKEISFHLDTFLQEKISKARTLASTPLLVDALVADNRNFARLDPSERPQLIDRLNQRWMAAGDAPDPFVQGYLDNPIATFLNKQRSLLPGEYGEIFLTNRFGAIIASTGKLTTLAHAHKQWWKVSYNDGQGKTFIDDRGFDESVNGYVLGIVVPVYSEDSIVGILKCNLNIRKNLDQFIQNFSFLTRDGFLKIVRSKGLVVISAGEEPLTTRVSDELIRDWNHSDNSALIVTAKNGQEHIVAHSAVKTTLGSSAVGFGGTKHTIDQRMGNNGEAWHAVACIPVQQAMAQFHKTDNVQVVVGITTILVSAFVAFLFGGKIARPVARLSEAAEKISRGDLNVKIDESDDSDIGKAARAFNLMAGNLKKTEEARDQLMQNRMRSAQLEVLGTVAAGVAHEINNPIQGIMNYATMIKNARSENERVNDCARRIILETDRVATITRNLLFYSRENNLAASEADAVQLIIDALSLVEKKLHASGVHIEKQLPDERPSIMLFPQLFQQAVLNLVDNAYDALRHKEFNSDIPTLTIKGRILEDVFELEIKDNGEGIPANSLSKIKTPFFTTKPSAEGTGLGLAIVDEIVEKHQGRVVIDSAYGQFTKVTMTLPLYR